MSPCAPSTRAIHPGFRAGRRSSRYRSAPVSPRQVGAVVPATVPTGDSTAISANHPEKLTPAELALPGVWTAKGYLRGRIEGISPPLGVSRVVGPARLPEIARLIAELEATRWTGRPGYPVRAMVGMALAKSIYSTPTWTRTVALVRDHAGLRLAVGCPLEEDVPSVYAVYRFAAKLRAHRRCWTSASNRDRRASQAPAAVRQRHCDRRQRHARLREWSALRLEERPRARTLLRPGGLVGPSLGRLDAQRRRLLGLQAPGRCLHRDRPSGRVGGRDARENESMFVAALLDAAKPMDSQSRRARWTRATTTTASTWSVSSVAARPIVPLRLMRRRERGEHLPPSCEHGRWRFAGSDYRRGVAKWRCPTGECVPASTWVKTDRLHPLIPRETLRSEASTAVAQPSSASSAASNTSGRCCPSACVASTA